MAVRSGNYYPTGRPTDDPNAIPFWVLSSAYFAIRADYTVLNGSRITQFTDQTGNGHHWTEPSNNGPTYTESGINGKPTATCDGTSQYVVNNSIGSPSAGEVFIVAKQNADPVPNDSRAGFWRFGSFTFGDHIPYTDGNVYCGWGSTQRPNCGNPAASLASPFCLNVTSETNNFVVRLNEATTLFSTVSNTVGWDSEKWLFRSKDASYLGLEGQIAEVIMFNRACSTQERADMHVYLRGRYGYP